MADSQLTDTAGDDRLVATVQTVNHSVAEQVTGDAVVVAQKLVARCRQRTGGNDVTAGTTNDGRCQSDVIVRRT